MYLVSNICLLYQGKVLSSSYLKNGLILHVNLVRLWVIKKKKRKDMMSLEKINKF